MVLRFRLPRADAIDVAALVQALMDLRLGQAIDVPIYDFASHQRSDQVQRMKAADVVIVEGAPGVVMRSLGWARRQRMKAADVGMLEGVARLRHAPCAPVHVCVSMGASAGLELPRRARRSSGTQPRTRAPSPSAPLLCVATERVAFSAAVPGESTCLARRRMSAHSPAQSRRFGHMRVRVRLVWGAGILVLALEEVRNLLHMKIFVDLDDDVRWARLWVGGRVWGNMTLRDVRRSTSRGAWDVDDDVRWARTSVGSGRAGLRDLGRRTARGSYGPGRRRGLWVWRTRRCVRVGRGRA